MKKINTTCLAWALLGALVSCGHPPASSPAKLVAGPMPGWSGHREVEIWAMFEGTDLPRMDYWPEGRPEEKQSILPDESTRYGKASALVRYRPSLLLPGTRYAYRLEVPQASGEAFFQTQADWSYKSDAPDFSFIFGSCLYLNDPLFDRPGKPYGDGGDIPALMAGTGADFMLWLGDNVYLRPADWTSPAGIQERYRHVRSDPALQPLWRSMHHFATWDDHDFGPNDSSKSFPLGDESRKVFRDFWANPPSGLPEEEGIMSTFVWSDCLFVLLDNRSHRDANNLDPATHPDKTMLGPRQIEWLEQTLLSHRQAPFKFIILGGQFLKDHTFESFKDFPADRRRILDFIQKQKVEGVVFISGDRHFTEVNRLERKGDYPLYEVTSSPISSGVATTAIQLETNNPLRVEGTLVDKQNFCRIAIHGAKDARTASLSSVDKTGVERWKLEIPARELRRAP